MASALAGATLTAELPVFQRSSPRDQIKAKSGPNTYGEENFSLLIMHICLCLVYLLPCDKLG